MAWFRLCALVACTLIAGVQCMPGKKPLDSDSEPQLRIMGGGSTTIEQYPWQVSVQRYKYHEFGGAILSPKWILTNADHFYDSVYVASDYNVVYGATNAAVGGGVSVGVTWVGYCPEYRFNSKTCDVGLMELAKDIVYSTVAQPIRMTARNTKPRSTDTLFVSGWGVTDIYDYDGPDTLQAVAIPYIPRATCEIAYGYRGHELDDTMICAGIVGKDVCTKDGGGALVDAWGTAWGVAAWGIGCGQAGFPGVYASLASDQNRDWIKNKTGIA